MGISSQICIQTTCREPGVINWVQFLEGLPLKFGRAKNRPKIFAISDIFRLWSRISPERIQKSKIEKAVDQLRPLPRWAKKVLNLSPQTKKLLTWVLTHRSAHLPGDCIFALGGLRPEIFTCARDLPRLPSAHPNWDGVPPPQKK